MFQNCSMRLRVALLFALFGAGVSILFSIIVFVIVQQLGNMLIDEFLQMETDEYAKYSIFLPHVNKQMTGYAISDSGFGGDQIPAEIKKLSPGTYNVSVEQVDLRVLVSDQDNGRYYMTFDTRIQAEHEAQFFRYAVLFALFMTISSSAGGLWLAVRITAPISRLARQVGQAEPGDADLALSSLTSQDEVGELARAFDRYLRRLREFIEREKYFTADVSHELRTPLAIMLGAVEVLEQVDTPSPRQKVKLARIRRAAQDMIELSSALLLMAREQPHVADATPCHAAEVVRACVEKHMHLIAGRPIRMEVELVAEPSLLVERPLLEILVGNLIRNALFNTRSGHVLLRLEAQRLTVQDTGVGMSADELTHVFERYYKGAQSSGSGVGLSLVKRICERYGWNISLDSVQGQGTTAVIDFSASIPPGTIQTAESAENDKV